MQFTIPDQALVSGGFVAQSRAIAITTNIPANVNVVYTGGYYSVGDQGGASYKRVNAAPAHIGYFQSADGSYWEIFGSSISPRQLGAKGDDVTDDILALNASIFLSDYTTYWDAGTYRFSGSIICPVYKKVIGSGRDCILKPTNTAAFTANYMFMYNSTDGVNWTVAFPLFPVGGIQNVWFNNIGLNANNKAIFSAGGVLHQDLMFSDCNQSIVTYGGYDDNVNIIRCFTNNPSSANYAIDVRLLGDNLYIQGCFFNYGASTFNNHIKVDSSQGGSIKNIIQGNIYLKSCDSVTIEELHLERGYLTIEASNAIVTKSYFWPQATTPSIDVVGGGQRTIVKLSDLTFAYDVEYSSASFFGYDVRITSGASININNCKRRTLVSGNIAIIHDAGIFVCKSDNTSITNWNNFSNKLSVNGSILANYFVPLNLNYYGPDGGANIFSSVQASNKAWLKPTGTQYYRAAQMLSAPNLAGKLDSNGERSFAATLGANGGSLLVISLSNDCFIRVYRGTVSGSYDYYVDVPVMNSSLYYDNGECLNGYPWIARAAGPADTLFDATYITVQTSNNITKSTGSSPAQGTWLKGDLFYRVNPVGAGTYGAVCTVAGSPGTWVNF